MRNLIKKKMIDAGRDDFVNYMAEILNISRQTASNKLNGKSEITQSEMALLASKLGISSEELAKTITKE